jgi:SPX domain protein involved in polyphosphate accumulation|tara:strand:+ start:33 stop:626 length:594 start_codon:yes stop_codon:yes gene_type:complete
MSYRIEEKLTIDNNRIIDFKSFLANMTVKPIYHPRRIKSLYFDNQNYEMYTDSIEGLTPRKKIRVRNYPETRDTKLYFEVKISSVEGRFKTRKIIDKNKFDYLKTKGILDSQYGLCKPCLYVIYDREYFAIDDVRISIDNNIRYRLYLENIYQRDESSIVEIKTSIRKNLDKLTEDFPFQKNRFSKYCNAVEKIIFK